MLDAIEPGIPIRRRPESLAGTLDAALLAAFAGLVLIAILLGLAEPGATGAGRSPSPSGEISSDELDPSERPGADPAEFGMHDPVEGRLTATRPGAVPR